MRVHIGGVMYGYCNIGDDAILEAMVNSFSDKCHLSVATQNPEWIKKHLSGIEAIKIAIYYTKPKLGLRFILNKNPRKISSSIYGLLRNKDYKLYSKVNLYICGGATILSDCPWYSMMTVNKALKAGAKTVMFGVGMAELSDLSSTKLIKNTCNKLEDVYVRDNFVKNRLINVGVKEKKMKICYDPAIMLEPARFLDYGRIFDQQQKEKFFDSKINIGICLSGEKDIVKRYPFKKINKLLKAIIDKFDANIFFIPTTIKVDKSLMEKLCVCKRISFIDGNYSATELISIMKNISIVLSSRLHLNILSSIVGTPFIGLVRDAKISDYAKLFELPYIIPENFDVEVIVKKINIILNSRGELKEKICKKIKQMKVTHKKCVTDIRRKYYKRM
jgi:polysaccharide pyruvyl transferase WcaK-like protein